MTALRQTLRIISRISLPHKAIASAAFNTTARRWVQHLDADPATFHQSISKENSAGKIVLVDFYAEWCQPCKMLSPVLEKLTADPLELKSIRTGSGRAVDLVTVDTDKHVELAQQYNVSALPTVVAFKDGQAVSMFRGALPETQVRAFLEKL